LDDSLNKNTLLRWNELYLRGLAELLRECKLFANYRTQRKDQRMTSSRRAVLAAMYPLMKPDVN
jgi:hypothetical protein